jgi:hypothetical protein
MLGQLNITSTFCVLRTSSILTEGKKEGLFEPCVVTAYQKIILISEVVGTAKLGVWLLRFVRAFGSVSRPAAAAAAGGCCFCLCACWCWWQGEPGVRGEAKT